jgi:hypothetical protein
MAPERQEP